MEPSLVYFYEDFPQFVVVVQIYTVSRSRCRTSLSWPLLESYTPFAEKSGTSI